MYSYITKELPDALFAHFQELDGSRVGIFGHSMGGHGALTIVRCSCSVTGYWRVLTRSSVPKESGEV